MVRRCVKISSGQEYAAKIINTKKLSARGKKHKHTTMCRNILTHEQLEHSLGVTGLHVDEL